MNDEQTTAVIQRCLDHLASLDELGQPAKAIIQELFERSLRRLYELCSRKLNRDFPRLRQAPLYLETGDLAAEAVARLVVALRTVRPTSQQEFLGLANQHIRWALKDHVRRLRDWRPPPPLDEENVPARPDSDSELSLNWQRILQAMDDLPTDEREVFELVKIQELSIKEVATIVGVTEVTVRRRLNRALRLLAEKLNDLSSDSQ